MTEESMNLKINAKYQCGTRKEKKMIGEKMSRPIYPSIGKWINNCSISLKWNGIQ